ncbi:hypothetical protein KC727_00765 [Candidatus Kaiserbacteria bacterium]|nr:hypothetical protein [Candidatus Kaiserbacteria bacterium]
MSTSKKKADTEAAAKKAEERKNAHMKEVREHVDDSENIDELRTRLYERGVQHESYQRHTLESAESNVRAAAVPRAWHEESSVSAHDVAPSPVGPAPEAAVLIEKEETHSHRMKFAFAGVIFLIFSVGLSVFFLLFGNNTISGNNIAVSVSGPFAVGGGEELPIQVAVANQNTIPIEAATLIITYPRGTQSTTDIGKELYIERTQLNTIAPGEVINIPLSARVFGEENDKETITVAVEYRVAGSGATFSKDAEPFRFKISSSPVVISIDSIERISSGQELEMKVTVGSNAQTLLSDVLVKAVYPYGFSYVGASIEPISGQDTWRIDALKPEERITFTIRGKVTGEQNDDRVFTFSVGVPNGSNSVTLSSIFAVLEHEVSIEAPFLGATIRINGDTSESVVISGKDHASVSIIFANALDAVLYDAVVEARLDGSALNEVAVEAQNGFYNSNTNIARWDSVDVVDLAEIQPGETATVLLSLSPEAHIGSRPELTLEVGVKAKRVFEDKVPQEIVGALSRTIKIESAVTLDSAGLYSEGPFTNSGPVPPIAEQVTQYTYLLRVDNGSNTLSNAQVTAILPQYMTWLDMVTVGDSVTYDAVTRTMTWNIGTMAAGAHEEAWVQVSFLPSLSQVGTIPPILEEQHFTATDQFTKTTITEQSIRLTTALEDDPNPALIEGRVRKP